MADQNATTDAPAQLGRTAAELLAEQPAEIDWIIPGLLAPGWLIKLAAREKVGKGTLVYYLLGRLERAEPTVFGPSPAEPVTAVILTEEPAASIRAKVEAFGLERARIIYGYELGQVGWGDKVERLVDVATAERHGLVFLDNISRASGITDESGPELGHAVGKLGDALRAAALSGLVDHHHKKGPGAIEDKSRGGTALAGVCDVNVEMTRDGDWTSRRRKLTARGRIDATIWERTIERTADGGDYISLEQGKSSNEGGFFAVRRRVLDCLREHQDEELTATQLRGMVTGNAKAVGDAAKDLASDPAEPVRSRPGTRNSVLFRYDPEAAYPLVRDQEKRLGY